MAEDTVSSLMRAARQRLTGKLSDDPVQEVRLLAEWALAMSRLELVTRANDPVGPADAERFGAAIQRRLAGEPVHRIIGVRRFCGLELELSPATLEPRPDTETLVDLALEAGAEPARKPLRILDLGTGTGAVILALLARLPLARGTATDLSGEALATAGRNAARNGLERRVQFVEGSWFAPVTGRFGLIVSNPPYIRSGDIAGLDREVREHDPLLALDGGPDGLEPYRVIASGAGAFLEPDGRVAVEIGSDQAADVTAIFEGFGFARVALRQDLGGRDRALSFAMR